MNNAYVVLPAFDQCDNMTIVLVNKRKESICAFEKNLFVVEPGDYLCEKWSIDLLNKYGNTSHRISELDLYYISRYFMEIKSFTYLRDKLILESSSKKAIELDLHDYMLINGYTFVFPKYYLIELNIGKTMRMYSPKINARMVKYCIFKTKDYLKRLLLNHYIRIEQIKHCIKLRVYRSTIVSVLEKKGITNLEELKISTSGKALFFKGEINDREVFIKCWDLFSTTNNENRINEEFLVRCPFVPRWIGSAYNGRIYISEFVAGQNLHDLLSQRKLTVDESKSLVDFLLQCIEFLNQNALTHCDIRPENIILSEKGFLLSDWGWAFHNNPKGEKRIIRQLAFKWVGEKYRYSRNVINDKVSAFYLLRTVCPEECTSGYNTLIQDVLPY